MTEGATYDQRRLAGRAVRARIPRSAHEAWQPPDDRPDPIELLAENNLPRLPDLVPVRYGRMLASPFAFLRGSAVIMASDLASTPVTGLRVQACGDAHLGNFGVFATPERNLVFDVNDFDETLPGPWEWDLKRLAVSVIVAAGNLQIDAGQAAAFTTATIRAYRERMAELAVMGPLDAWYDRIDVAAVLTLARQRRAKDLQRQLSPAKLRHRTSLHVLPKLTSVVNGTRKIIDDPPLIGHFDPEAFDGQEMIAAYAESLPPDRRPLLGRYHVLDTARKVVGVGSVGTRCYLSLLTDADARSPIFLQLKEAMEAVLAPYSGKSEFAHAGQRVVVGQRLMQAASDMFLGWTSYRGHDYYVRQFRDMKGSVNLDAMTPSGFASYAEVCGRTLARAHARSGDAATIAGYTGTGTRFDASITAFAQAYGEQVRRDYDALVVAVESGRITAAKGLLAAPKPGRARKLPESRMWRRPGSQRVSLVATKPGRFALLAMLLAAGLAVLGPAGRPAGPRGEVAAVGRTGSFGQARTEGIPVGGLAPGGFADAYDLHPLWNRGDLGQGQTIVFFEVDGYSPADLAAYDARFGLPAAPAPLPHIGPLNLKPAGESDMDIQAAHAIAPQARLVYVNLTSFGGKNVSVPASFLRAFSTVARDYPGAIWSVSLGQCEDIFSPADLAAVDGAVAAAERAGTTAFVASGDEGGLECLGAHQQDARIPAQGISFPGDLPAVTSVGGTTLALTPAGQYLGETAWTEPLLSQGSTGGPSAVFPAPPWQQAPGVASQYADGSGCGQPAGAHCREVPDVAADAAPQTGAAIRIHGRWLRSGGTSLATPVWAAITALIDQYLTAHGGRPAGFVNPLLYRLARGSPPYRPFHEVTAGTNDVYPAGPGYNMVTGLGTPDAWNLARDLALLTGRAR